MLASIVGVSPHKDSMIQRSQGGLIPTYPYTCVIKRENFADLRSIHVLGQESPYASTRGRSARSGDQGRPARAEDQGGHNRTNKALDTKIWQF